MRFKQAALQNRLQVTSVDTNVGVISPEKNARGQGEDGVLLIERRAEEGEHAPRFAANHGRVCDANEHR